MSQFIKGMAMAGTAACCWGAMGVAAQYLMTYCHFSPMDLVSIRMLVAGGLFVLLEAIARKGDVFRPFFNLQNFVGLWLYTFTIIATQLTFFICIQYSNAPFAAVLTATVPLWIMLWMFVYEHKKLTKIEVLCAFVALSGVVLVVTGGDFSQFNVSMMGLVMGILSGIASALYVLVPQKLIKRVGSGLATSWALFLTGVVITLFSHFWNEPLDWTWMAVLAYGFIVVFGTILSFWLFQLSVEYIPAEIAGMMETLDPVASTVLGVILLGLTMNFWEVVGGALILMTVIVLAVPSKHPGSLQKIRADNHLTKRT